MLPAKDFLANLQRLFEQRLGFGMVAHRLIKRRQVVQASCRIGMLIAFRTPYYNNQFLRKRDRLLIFSLMIKFHDLAAQPGRTIIVSWSLPVNYKAEAKRQEQDD